MDLKAPQWVYWVIGTASAMLSLSAFVYANFPTRIEFNSVESRLERIENKIDSLLRLERQ